MMLLLLQALPAFAGKWDGLPTDIVAERVIQAPAERVTGALADLALVSKLVPADCIGRWEVGQRTAGEGATAQVRYDIGLMHRSLALTVSRVVTGRYVDWDHPGRTGFVTRFTVAPLPDSEGSSRVKMESYFTGPPWPLKRYYHRVMKPEWEGCQGRTLEALSRSLAGS
jgi:uncharacterized protein YndB with AHSA1/START domain